MSWHWLLASWTFPVTHHRLVVAHHTRKNREEMYINKPRYNDVQFRVTQFSTLSVSSFQVDVACDRILAKNHDKHVRHDLHLRQSHNLLNLGMSSFHLTLAFRAFADFKAVPPPPTRLAHVQRNAIVDFLSQLLTLLCLDE